MAEQHVDAAIAIGAQDAGLDVVMDACPKIEWPRYGAPSPTRSLKLTGHQPGS
jgi:hypothetical protein